VLRRPAARKRVLAMRGTFGRYREALTAVALVGTVPQPSAGQDTVTP
jgi:hypothetical protein